jgi:NAD+ synthase
MSAFPKISIAQINPTVGDIADNSQLIIDAWKKASADGAEMVLFPELSVIGYPPQDLVLMPDFRKKAMAAVQEIASKTAVGASLVLGCVWKNEGKIYNAAILIDGGKILHIQPKNRLPNYGVFDEKRIFSAGDLPQVINWRERKIGLLICEDIWDESLAENLGAQGAEMIFSINASPFEVGKMEQRKQVVCEAARAANAPVYYANMVGGQDDIIFDGGSFATNSAGEIICQFPQFEEKTDLLNEVRGTNYELREQQIWRAITLALRDYIRKNNFKSVVLGLSGGIDSAVSAAVAVDALGAENVLGVLLPSPYSSAGSVSDALETAKLLGIKTKIIPLAEAMKTFQDILTPTLALPLEGGGDGSWMEEPAIGGNLQARIRGIILMALSNAGGNLLLSTGNKSELAVGYSTLYGDSCGGYNVLKDIYKTDVYKLANWRNSKSPAIPKNSIEKPPSAELKPNQRDDDQLPPYDILDAILAHHIEGRLGSEEIIAKGFVPEIVKKVLHLVRISEYKRQQSCLGAKISPMNFGKDRRFPVTNKF